MIMNLLRLLKHLIYPDWWLRRRLPASAMSHIERAIADLETRHGGEIRVALEATLDVWPLLRGRTAHDRAIEVFSSLRVWDTEANNGVLIYVLLADRDVEIVADRGVASHVAIEQWEDVCHEMERRFREGLHENALLYGVRAIGQRLQNLYPLTPERPNELPDRPLRI